MSRTLWATTMCALLLVGCGSGAESSSDASADGSDSAESPSSSPSATYFVKADTAQINKVAAKAQRSAVAAQNRKRLDACDATTAEGYAAWRACWHDLLDPFTASLQSVAATMTELSTRDLPDSCREELEQAARTFAARAKVISGLLAGIDSEQRKDQDRAMRTYTGSLEKMVKSWSEPFQALTQVCYSPEDLESINATPSPSP